MENNVPLRHLLTIPKGRSRPRVSVAYRASFRSCRRRPRLPSSWPGVDGQLRRGWGEIDFRLPCACAVLKKDREWANSDKILERSTGPWDRQRGCRSRWIAGPRCPVSSRSLRSCCIQVGGFGVMYDDERRRRRRRRRKFFFLRDKMVPLMKFILSLNSRNVWIRVSFKNGHSTPMID